MTAPFPKPSLYHYRFDRTYVPSGPWEDRIKQEFEAYGEELRALGLTHFAYRAVNVGKDGTDINVMDLFFLAPSYVDIYYARDFSAIVNAIAHSNPPYKLTFFTRAEQMINPKYVEFVQQGFEHGMLYDFMAYFRDSPRAGGGVTGGRHNTKLDKPVLRQAFGLSVDFHWRVREILGEIALERTALTDTELRYLQLMFYGLSQREIAETSGVSRNWVAKACMALRRKLDVDTDAAAVAKGLALKILR